MFRFSIRELFLTTTIVALTFGWWLDHHRLIIEQRTLMSAMITVIQKLSLDKCNVFGNYYNLRRQSDPTIQFDDLYNQLFDETIEVKE